MDQQNNKTFYKGISLFIKWVILISSLYYIWDKLSNAELHVTNFPDLNLNTVFLSSSIFLLMFVNWGLEAFKWQLLIAPLEKITFLASLRSVFAGVTVSIFTPNRVGEFAGRVFVLQKADKIKASLMSLMGSLIQLVVTVLTGILAYYILESKYYDYFQTEQFFSTHYLLLFIVLLFIMLGGILFFLAKKGDSFPWFKKYVDVINTLSKKKLELVFYISCLRYIVFSTQYFLTLKLFGITGGTTIILSLISLTFLVTSAIPTFALTEITVRTGTAIYFFGTISVDHSAIIASSLFLWIINLAMPALIGAGVVWKMKFFKTE